MINPLAPYALRGVIWYQGEQNGGRAGEYRALFPALINGWRGCLSQPAMPFYWVQLANYRANDPKGDAWAFLRAAQAEALALPGTGQAVAIDIGNVTDVHPRNKRDVGRRLALLALRHDYGQEALVAEGPAFSGAVTEGAAMRVRFGRPAGPLISPKGMGPAGFELAGEDRVFHPAEAVIEGDGVLVKCAGVPNPVAVRYAWRNAPEAGLYNNDGLPAAPFRSDDWCAIQPRHGAL
jgi:sialate O-acetylesterase